MSEPCAGGPRSPVQGLGGDMQWCRSHETHLDSTLSSWHQQFLLEGCVISPSLDLDFLICNRQRSPSHLPVLATLSVDHSEQVSPCWVSCEVRRAKDLQQAVSTQTGCPCGPGPLEKQRRSNSRQREGLLQGPPAEMPMELGGQLNRLIKTRVRKLMKGEWEMKLMRWWEYLLGKLDFTLRLVYTHWSRRGSCAKSHLVFWSFPTWPTALQEFFSFEYFLVQLMSFSPTDV